MKPKHVRSNVNLQSSGFGFLKGSRNSSDTPFVEPEHRRMTQGSSENRHSMLIDGTCGAFDANGSLKKVLNQTMGSPPK